MNVQTWMDKAPWSFYTKQLLNIHILMITNVYCTCTSIYIFTDCRLMHCVIPNRTCGFIFNKWTHFRHSLNNLDTIDFSKRTSGDYFWHQIFCVDSAIEWVFVDFVSTNQEDVFHWRKYIRRHRHSVRITNCTCNCRRSDTASLTG